MFRVILLGFLILAVSLVVAPTATYAMSLDDDEEDAEDVADLLEKAKSAGKSESFFEANALLKKAKMYGVSTDDTQEASKYVAQKKQARDDRVEIARKEKERLARLKREKEERARQARLAQSQKVSTSSRYITSLGYDAPSYQYDKYTLCFRPYISISDGTHIYAKVTQLYRGDCYQLLVGSNDSSIYGNCSNCSNNTNGYWSCHANSSGSFTVNGNQAEAANGIVQRSR